jgi:3-deoxy-D-manno-octulosonic-acid transferase
MLSVYNTLLLPLRLAVAVAAARSWNDPARSVAWRERRARMVPDVPAGGVWIHGASVGEARVSTAVGRALRREHPDLHLAFSAVTDTGRAALPAPPLADAAFHAPLDFRGWPGRVLDALAPAALVLVETELWPNLIHEASDRGVPIVVVNGRLSPERMSRYRRWAALYRPLMRRLTRVGAQSTRDAERFVDAGLQREVLEVTGNVKYDMPASDADPGALRARFGLDAERPVIVAGSTGDGEDPAVLDAFLVLREAVPEAFLVLAPRHPERADDVARDAGQRGVRLHRLSAGSDGDAGRSDGLLLDTVGELASLYAVARVAFVGGSLVPIGGHNVLEPAAAGVPVLFGPHTEHFAEPAEALERAGGGFRVADGADLAARWIRFLQDPDLAEGAGRLAVGVVEANAGALARTVKLIGDVLEPGGARSREDGR